MSVFTLIGGIFGWYQAGKELDLKKEETTWGKFLL